MLQLFCYSQSECDVLAQEMQKQPQLFFDLRLLLSVASQLQGQGSVQQQIDFRLLRFYLATWRKRFDSTFFYRIKNG
jgi:hypothetical protein